MTKAAILTDRTVLKIAGADARTFLQGLITNDIQKLSYARPLYAALLTPQGKIICDFILSAAGDDIYLDCATARAADLVGRLKKYRLRAKVTIDEQGETLEVLAASEAHADIRLPLARGTSITMQQEQRRTFTMTLVVQLDAICDGKITIVRYLS